MYNRYIPEDVSYTPVEKNSSPDPSRDNSKPMGRSHQQPFRFPDFLSKKESLSAILGGREGAGLSGLLKWLHLDHIDSGDILLLLIMLYLLVEGDDLELVIALGLVLIMGLGEENEDIP